MERLLRSYIAFWTSKVLIDGSISISESIVSFNCGVNGGGDCIEQNRFHQFGGVFPMSDLGCAIIF